MTYQNLEVSTAGRVTTITLNRPAVLNAITGAMHQELQLALDAFAADDDQYICVMTGAGERAFCAGSDLKSISKDGPYAYPRNGYAGLIERFDLEKPLIAAVNGICLGGGFEIALACDLIIATDNAIFGLPEPKVGAIALGGGLHRLVRQIGEKRAMGYILTGNSMSAAEAFDLGLVNEVVPPTQLHDAVERWCGDILSASPVSVRTSKDVVQKGLAEPDLESALRNQNDYASFKRWQGAEDTREGIDAFAEKRSPQWTGR